MKILGKWTLKQLPDQFSMKKKLAIVDERNCNQQVSRISKGSNLLIPCFGEFPYLIYSFGTDRICIRSQNHKFESLTQVETLKFDSG